MQPEREKPGLPGEPCCLLKASFLPLVAESTGAWEPEAAKVLQHISGAVAAREGAEASVLHSELLQELCVTAQMAGSHEARAAGALLTAS